MKSHSTELYALMARYLAGESSREEVARMEKLLVDHPELRSEFDLFKDLFSSAKDEASEKPIQKDFDRITRRLKDEGLL